MRSTRAAKGFTLIEMLIVVAIVGILASIVLVGLGPVQRQGRDARRISDLRQVQTGLELYYNRNAQYPTNITNWASLQSSLTQGGIGVSNVPADPRNTSPYIYKYWTDSNGDTYVLGAQMEDTDNPALANDIDGNSFEGRITIECGSGSPETPPIYCISL